MAGSAEATRETANEERAHSAFLRHHAFYDKLNETTVSSGTLAIRSAFILNGGACLALIAFAANTLTADNLPAAQTTLILEILGSLSFFAWGAFCSAIATGIAYLANRVSVIGNYKMTLHYDAPYVRRNQVTDRLFAGSNVLQVLAIAATVMSLLFFVFALLRIAGAIPKV